MHFNAHAMCSYHDLDNMYFFPRNHVSKNIDLNHREHNTLQSDEEGIISGTDSLESDGGSKVRSLPNRWTNRDENNLRRPCISKVIGMLNKSDAHRR